MKQIAPETASRSIAQSLIAASLVGAAILMAVPMFGPDILSSIGITIPALANLAVVICLGLAGVAIWGRKRPAEATRSIPLSQQPGGKLLLSYQVASFVVLRLYGAAFLAIAYGFMIQVLKLPNIVPASMGSPAVISTLCAVTGLVLLIPVLTPKVLSRPQTVLAGVFKALILIILSAPIYFLGITFLESGAVAHGSKFTTLMPMLFKSIAGLSVTGAIMVSMATQLTEEEKTPQPIYDRLSNSDLQSLRRSRMSGSR